MFLALHNLGVQPGDTVEVSIHANYQFAGCKAHYGAEGYGYMLYSVDSSSETYETHSFTLYRIGDALPVGGENGWLCLPGYSLPAVWVVDNGVV